MTPDLQKKLVRVASYVFTVIVIGAFFAQNWMHTAYWLLPVALFVVIVLRLLALLISDKSKRLVQKLIERLPMPASFLILFICTGVVCFVLAVGLREGLKISKKYFPNSGPVETHGTSDSVTAVVQHPQTPPEAAKPVPEPVPEPVSKPVSKPVAKPSLTKPKVKISKETTNNNATGNITSAPGGIVNNGGTITNPTVINVPSTNPLDTYDGKPDLKVAEDAIGMANRFLNSVQSCDKGIHEAGQQDIDSKDPDHTMYHQYISRTKHNIRRYSKDLRDLHTSLIYRLGPAERDANADEVLDRLLEQPNQFNRYYFYCEEFQEIGDYFSRLGNKLKVRASVHP
jgi:hypothetical protein